MNPDLIPPELKERDQFCVFVIGPEKDANGKLVKKPLIAGSVATHPSSTDYRTWRSFAEACLHRERHYAEQRPGECFIAYVLCKKDGIVFVDMDEGIPEQDVDTILQAFPNGFVEDSASGKGVHLLIRGNLKGGGSHKKNLGLFDTARWCIMTGDVWPGHETLGEGDEFELRELEKQMETGVFHFGGSWEDIPTRPEVDDDETVISKCLDLHRNGKFRILFQQGYTDKLGYDSQSEADYALVGMLADVSRNNEQVKRLFLHSPMYRSQKPKAVLYALRRLRARQEAQDKTDLLYVQMAKEVQEKAALVVAKPAANDLFTSIPAGLLKDVYEAYMDWTFYPVRESCLIAALATTLAIFQRKYQTPTRLGLNMWLFLVGDAASGKDVINQGPPSLFLAAKAPMEGVLSGQMSGHRGLFDSLRNNPRQCSYHPECAAWLKSMCAEHATEQSAKLRDALISSWSKSTTVMEAGQRSLERGGKKEPAIPRPCLTIYGDAVPEFFYNAVGTSQIAGGFMPRFTVLEVNTAPGMIPEDPGPQNPFPDSLLATIHQYCRDTCEHDACMGDPVKVPWASDKAAKMFDKMRRDLRVKMLNKNCNPLTNYKNTLIGRSAEKALKLATLLAICENPATPAVAEHHMQWATGFVTATDTRMIEQLVSGDHDEAAHNQLGVMRGVILRAMRMNAVQRSKAGYSTKADVLANPNLIPYAWLSSQCRAKGCFQRAKQGPPVAVDNTIKELINHGLLVEYSLDEKAKSGWVGRMFLNIGVVEEN